MQACRRPASRALAAARRPAEPSPTPGPPSLEAGRVPSSRRLRPLASHGLRPRPSAARLVAEAGYANSYWSGGGAHPAHRGGYVTAGGWAGAKAPEVPYITHGSGEGASLPIPAERSGWRTLGLGRTSLLLGFPGQGPWGAVNNGRAGPGGGQVRGTPGVFPGVTPVVPEDAVLWGEGPSCVPIVLIFPKLAVSSARQYR